VINIREEAARATILPQRVQTVFTHYLGSNINTLNMCSNKLTYIQM